MYEAFYLLRTRPFGLDSGGCWLTPEVGQSLQHALASLQNGAEVIVVTGPSGSGKTTVCQEIAQRLSDRLRPVLLPHCEYACAGDLWRSILFGLGVEFSDVRDDDARLSVLRVARSERPERNGLLVIADNAENLSDALLEDLRRLTVQRHEGRPIVQLVLCGAFELEERLALPELQTFSRRIGQQIVLELLTREQSRHYLAHRLESAGGSVSEIFTDDALDAISAAADGNLYCLNQLADHALLLGFANEERPVGAATVAAALEDLKGLPLPWNVPLSADGAASGAEILADAPEVTAPSATEPDGDRQSWWDAEGDAAAIEVGADRSAPPHIPSPVDASQMTPPSETANASDDHRQAPDAPESADLTVDDPYARLDRLAEQGQAAPDFQPPVVDRPASLPAPEVEHTQRRAERLRTHSGGMETKLLLDVTALRNEIRAAGDVAAETPAAPVPSRPVIEMAPTRPDWDIVEPELESVPDVDWSEQALADLDGKFARTEPMLSIKAGIQPAADHEETTRTDASPQRRYARLFTRLRERRAATEQETATWPLRLWR